MSLKKNLNKDRINKQLVFLMKIGFNPDKISKLQNYIFLEKLVTKNR